MPEIATSRTQFFYQRHGATTPDADGQFISVQPLLLVHGAGGTLMNWPPAIRRLPETTVYALDLPGHGKSRRHDRESQGSGAQGSERQDLESIVAYSDAILDFTDALELSEFFLVGHSMGSAIAMQFALQHPDRLAGLVLIGASASLAVAPSILTGLQSQYDETCAWLTKLLFGPDTVPSLSDAYLKYLSTLDKDLVRNDFIACDAFDLSEQIQAIRAPTLIICGSDDKMTPPSASRYLHEEIADSRLELIDNAGHMVMLEQPQAVAAQMTRFLDAIAARSRK